MKSPSTTSNTNNDVEFFNRKLPPPTPVGPKKKQGLPATSFHLGDFKYMYVDSFLCELNEFINTAMTVGELLERLQRQHVALVIRLSNEFSFLLPYGYCGE